MFVMYTDHATGLRKALPHDAIEEVEENSRDKNLTTIKHTGGRMIIVAEAIDDVVDDLNAHIMATGSEVSVPMATEEEEAGELVEHG